MGVVQDEQQDDRGALAQPTVTSSLPSELSEAKSDRPSVGLTPASLLLVIFAAYFLYKIEQVLVLLIVGVLLATVIERPVESLHRRLGLGRGLSILVLYLLLIAGLGLFLFLLLPPIVREATRFAQELPALAAEWRAQLEASDNAVTRALVAEIVELVNNQTNGGTLAVSPSAALDVVSNVGGALVSLFTIFLITFYWLTEKAVIKHTVVGLCSAGQRVRVLHLWAAVEQKLGAWIRGQLLLMLIIGGLATMAYGVMGLPFWLLLGLIAGLTEAIPNVGPVLGAIPAVLIALTVGWQWALIVIGFVSILQLMENAILVPRIMKGAVGISPLTVILAILAGGEFRGVVGALLAVPIAGALSVILGDVVSQRRQQTAAAAQRRWDNWLPRSPRRREAPVPPTPKQPDGPQR